MVTWLKLIKEIGMDIPFGGLVSARLVEKRFKNHVFYFVHNQQGDKGFCIKYGFLMLGGMIKHPMIRSFDKNNNLSSFSQGCCWDRIHANYDDASKQLKHIERLYTEGFTHRPFIKVNMINEIKPTLIGISKAISYALGHRADFKGVHFCDVSAGGIQVMSCGYSHALRYDMSNVIDTINYYLQISSKKQ
jgi:hypothetical protein